MLEGTIVAGAVGVPAWTFTRWSVFRWAALAASRYQVVDGSVTRA